MYIGSMVDDRKIIDFHKITFYKLKKDFGDLFKYVKRLI